MKLVIDNQVITEPIEKILQDIRIQTGGRYLSYIGSDTGRDIKITCPWHKDGQENRASCHCFTSEDDPKIMKGTCHCFTCGKSYPLWSLVSTCLNITEQDGKQWLVDRYAGVYLQEEIEIPTLDLTPEQHQQTYIDESILDNYNYFHPYMFERNLSEEVIRKFRIGYDKEHDCITFPVWDEYGNLVEITRRAIKNKMYFLTSGIDKPVYLLNFVLQQNINSVIVCEGQIDALVAWSYGYPAVALFGSGTTDSQIEKLNRSGIINFILMYDNDGAGKNGAKRFQKLISKDRFVTNITMPIGKDIGGCTKEEFWSILHNNGVT